MLYRELGIKNRQELKQIVLYARVSSAGQKPDLENQLHYLKEVNFPCTKLNNH